jgi:hypothetical protein
MKKSYIKPEALEVKFETQGVIATSLPIFDDEINSGEQDVQQKDNWDLSDWD